MPKVNKETFKILPKTNIQIYKFEQGKNYYCQFYIGSGHKGYSSKRFQKCLKTQNINDAISKATEHYKEWFKNGQLKSEENFNDKGEPDGSHKEWNTNGNQIKECNFKLIQ